MKNIEYVIIGNSTAAVGAVEGIRRVDAEGGIAVISMESYHTYSRPLISHFLAGEMDEAGTYYRPADFYKKNSVTLMSGVEISGIDISGRKLFASGARKELSYKKLLIAVGGKPFIPDIRGLDAQGVFSFTSLDDAKKMDGFLKEKFSGKSNVKAVIVGGGLIGVKCAEALHARGVGVLIVELGKGILSLALDEYASSLAGEALREAGIETVCDAAVDSVLSDNGAVCGVTLKTGCKELCDMVVIATGVVPAVDFLRNSDIEIDRGIVVDDKCATSVPGIFAAGDVAQSEDSLTGVLRVIPIFPNAFRQGYTAGVNMAGGSAVMSSNMAMNSVSICGMPAISVGLSIGKPPEFKVIEKKSHGRVYKKIVIKDGLIVGALFTGDIARAGIITGMIRQGVSIEGIEDILLTDEFGVISLPGEYRKHLIRGEGMEV